MVDRIHAPLASRDFSFHLIDPEIVHQPDGKEFYFVNGGEQNVIKIELVSSSGRWYEPAWGVSHFTAHMLTRGTKTKNSFQIASTFDSLGAQPEVKSGSDFVTLSLYTLTKKLSPALELFREIIQTPTFPEKELEQAKAIYLQNLKVNHEKTSFLASKLFRKTIFGDHHPYGKELDERDINKITSKQLESFHHDFFKDLQIIVSGKINAESRQQILDSFAPIISEKAMNKSYPLSTIETTQLHQDKEDSVQSSLRIGKKIIGRSHPDYADVLLVNHLLGGYFGSRLMKNIREEKGLTYGIHSSINNLRQDGYLAIGTDVNKENRELAFQEIKNELTRLCEELISDEELDTARQHFIGSLQTELSTAFAHAEKIRNIVLFDLDTRYYSKLIERVSHLNSGNLLNTANQYFHPNNFVEVSVG